MSSIFLTGSSGFIGQNLKFFFESKYEIFNYQRNYKIKIKQKIVIHLAGIAHDTSSSLNRNIYYDVNTELTKKIFDEFLKIYCINFYFY